MSEIEDRRQRAREAFHDHPSVDLFGALGGAIEVATQVKITDEVIDVLFSAGRDSITPRATGRAQIRLVLEALGFEVIE